MRAAGPAASLTHAGAQQRGKVARPARPGARAGRGARRRHLLRATGGCLGPAAGAADRREQGQRGRTESVPQTTRTELCSVCNSVDRPGTRAKDRVRPGPGRTSERASPHFRHSSWTRQDTRRSRTLPTRVSQRSACQRTARLQPCSSWPHTPLGTRVHVVARGSRAGARRAGYAAGSPACLANACAASSSRSRLAWRPFQPRPSSCTAGCAPAGAGAPPPPPPPPPRRPPPPPAPAPPPPPRAPALAAAGPRRARPARRSGGPPPTPAPARPSAAAGAPARSPVRAGCESCRAWKVAPRGGQVAGRLA